MILIPKVKKWWSTVFLLSFSFLYFLGLVSPIRCAQWMWIHRVICLRDWLRCWQFGGGSCLCEISITAGVTLLNDFEFLLVRCNCRWVGRKGPQAFSRPATYDLLIISISFITLQTIPWTSNGQKNTHKPMLLGFRYILCRTQRFIRKKLWIRVFTHKSKIMKIWSRPQKGQKKLVVVQTAPIVEIL